MSDCKSPRPAKPVRRSAASASRLTGHRPPRPSDGPDARPGLNDAESPLSWLRTRLGKRGEPLISTEQYLAGERLRLDFERSMMVRRTTTSWDMAGAGSRGNASLDVSDAAIASRQRFHKAMDAVGPELASILYQVCCMAAGLEQAERLLNLPQRSGKAVLGLALTSLARHYGLLKNERRSAAGVSQWGLDDYRPAIAQPELEDA